jgi:hypothetical protein
LNREIVQDFVILEDSKIIQDDDKFLVVKAVIASEIVHKYQDGMVCAWILGKKGKEISCWFLGCFPYAYSYEVPVGVSRSTAKGCIDCC